ncbi:MAG: helix-turn-helix domain-containing protein [Clostridia bacterium]|nr:helix-turn-helix domain-containing protein [Clostridia bacterium]
MSIGKKIKQLRLKASFTQEQLAENLGVSPQAVSKWENEVTMPDITLLPLFSEVFGVTIDDMFDLTVDQRLKRIENRMLVEEEFEFDVFREYRDYLSDQLKKHTDRQRILSLLARLYHHRMESDAKKAAKFAREAIFMAPEKKDCQWILQKAEGSQPWDWNVSNHAGTIEFYKSVIDADDKEPKTPLPYYYLIDNLLADHRTNEAKEYLARFKALPAHNPIMVQVYEADIALKEYDEEKADAIIEKALFAFKNKKDILFEAAQYYAKKSDYGKAIEYYEKYFSASENEKPRFTDPLEGISVIYEIMGEYIKAAETQKRILAVLKDEWGITDETVVADTEKKIEILLKKANG